MCPCVYFVLQNLKKKQMEAKVTDEETAKPEAILESKKVKNSRIHRIPKIGCIVPFIVTLLTNISDSGTVPTDVREIMKAANIIIKAKKDLDEGNPWNGDIDITENLKLKLYKSGLILYSKK